ncbi:MAG: IPT/TIG domain-containing protein [Pseudobdellovibrio sp.]
MTGLKKHFKNIFPYLFSCMLLASNFSCVFKPDIEAIQAQLLPFKQPTISAISPTTLFTGGDTEVTITGENFDAGLTVSVGGKNCTLEKIVGKETVVCLAPQQVEGSYEVVVTGVDGRKATSGVAYDGLAFTKLSLMVGKLSYVTSVTDNDGYFSDGDSLGAVQMSYEAPYLYTSDFQSGRLKQTDLTTLYSKTLANTANNTLGAAFSDNYCLVKTPTAIYFCITQYSIAKLDLSSNITTLISGQEDQLYPLDTGSNPLGNKYNFIKRIFLKGTDLYVVDKYFIGKIDLTNSLFSILAGDSNVQVVADGNGVSATMYEVSDAALVDDKIYFVDDLNSYAYTIRQLDISTSGTFAVNTLIDNLLSPTDGSVSATDGIGAAASMNVVTGMTPYKDSLLVLEMDPDSNYKLRQFNLSTHAISTLNYVIPSQNEATTLGLLSHHAKLPYYRIDGMYYIENYGLILGTRYGMLKIQ